MRRFLIILMLVTLAAGPAHADPPSNDTPAGATVISSFPTTIEVDTSMATTGLYEEDCSGVGVVIVGVNVPTEAVWYRLDLPGGTEVIRVLHGEWSASVILWTQVASTPTGEPILYRMGCAYPEDYYPLYVTEQPTYMSVGTSPAWEVPPFPIHIQIPSPGAVPNDVPYRATRIASLPYEAEQETWDASRDDDQQGCSQGAYVWYTYAPATSETVEISVTARVSYESLTLAVYAVGSEVRTLGCDWGYGSSAASVATAVEGGVPVLIGIGRRGILSLSVRTIAPLPGPDSRAAAPRLTFGRAVTFNTAGATLEPGEPEACGSGGSIWFALPPVARAAEVTVTGAVSVAAVSGDDVLACSVGGALALDADVPATHLQLRSPSGAQGTIALHFTPPYGNQLTDASPLPEGCGDPTDSPYVNSEVEVSNAVDPNDPDHLLATWQQDRYGDRGGARGIGAAVSFDGGDTWTTSTIPGVSLCSGGPFLRATDPWAAIDADGTAYVMSLGYDPGLNNNVYGPNTVLLSRSEDGGTTWEAPIIVAISPGGLLHDKETLTADPNTPGLLYAVWDVYPTNVAFPVFARSEDGGRTWTPPVPLPTPGSGAGDQIAVLDDGTLVEIANRSSMQSITSRDRGLTWSLPTEFAPGPGAKGPRHVRGGAYIPSVSTDGHAVFVSWSDTFSSFFARSDDAGATWSVSEIRGTFYYPRRFTTAVAGTDTGHLALMTYMIDAVDNAWITLATSVDGGTTWSERPVTDTFDMARAPYSFGRGYFLGDYFGLRAAGDDVIAAFTAVPRGEGSGVSNVYTLRLTP